MYVSEMFYCEDCDYWFPVSYEANGTHVACEYQDQVHIDEDHELSGGIDH